MPKARAARLHRDKKPVWTFSKLEIFFGGGKGLLSQRVLLGASRRVARGRQRDEANRAWVSRSDAGQRVQDGTLSPGLASVRGQGKRRSRGELAASPRGKRGCPFSDSAA